MYDNIYGIPVDVIKICDLTTKYSFSNYGVASINISGLDRKTYITKEQFYTYMSGTVHDNMVSISRARLIGDVAPLSIGQIKDWSLEEFTRVELN